MPYDRQPKMSFCRLSLACALAGTMVTTVSTSSHGQQPPSSGGRKIEFSDPGRSIVASNLNSVMKEGATFQTPDELQKRYDFSSPGSSLQGIEAPPMQRPPAAPGNSKRLKELLEQRHDWIFLNPEDYRKETTAEEIFGIPEYGANGDVKEKKSPMERYFERLERGNTATNRARNDESFGSAFGIGGKRDNRSGEIDFSGAKTGPDESNEGGDLNNPLLRLIRGNSGNPWRTDRTKPAGLSDLFGRQNSEWKPDSPETLRAQAARLEEYKRILEMNTMPSTSPVSGIAPFDPFKLPGSASSTSPAFAFPRNAEPPPVTPITPIRDVSSPFSPVAGVMGVAARPVELPQLAPGVPGLVPSTPLPEPTRAVVPAPDFNIPKRRF